MLSNPMIQNSITSSYLFLQDCFVLGCLNLLGRKLVSLTFVNLFQRSPIDLRDIPIRLKEDREV